MSTDGVAREACDDCVECMRIDADMPIDMPSPTRMALEGMAITGTTLRQEPTIAKSKRRTPEQEQEAAIRRWLNPKQLKSFEASTRESPIVPAGEQHLELNLADQRLDILRNLGLNDDQILAIAYRREGWRNVDVGRMMGKSEDQVDKIYRSALRLLPEAARRRIAHEVHSMEHRARKRLLQASVVGDA